ncbi:MAG: hypothetical protein WA892_11750 [Ornithinimicrobium sp.]
MSLTAWWKGVWQALFPRRGKRVDGDQRPLREFIYLDEVSLRSLLTSKLHTVPENVSRAISKAEEVELSSKIAAGTELVAKSELGSRFKTSNSSTVETSRKAVVQTQFNELRYQAGVEFALTATDLPHSNVGSTAELLGQAAPDVAVRLADLQRGSLVEIEVRLEADPVFRFGTMLSEYAAMEEEYPAMFGANGSALLHETVPINNVLQRLLAGLIPIKAPALHLALCDVDGVQWLVNRKAVSDLHLELSPIHVVGVTEHIGYWKDIRRVLFSDAEVTLLCRVSRGGLHDSWTPVKLADLFKEVAPDLAKSLNDASTAGLATPSGAQSQAVDEKEQYGLAALLHYQNSLEAEAGTKCEGDMETVRDALQMMEGHSESASAQRKAFAFLLESVERQLGAPVWDADADLRARQAARSAAARLSATGATNDETEEDQGSDARSATQRLLDVEVVAIYW